MNAPVVGTRQAVSVVVDRGGSRLRLPRDFVSAVVGLPTGNGATIPSLLTAARGPSPENAAASGCPHPSRLFSTTGGLRPSHTR
jgi:hypothetical protein